MVMPDGGHRAARRDRSLARDVKPRRALLHCGAEAHILDLARLDACARDRFADDVAPEGRGFGVVERAAMGFADRTYAQWKRSQLHA